MSYFFIWYFWFGFTFIVYNKNYFYVDMLIVFVIINHFCAV